jgi:hypothetical protein
MKSRFEENAVPITGLPSAIASPSVSPKPSERCSET